MQRDTRKAMLLKVSINLHDLYKQQDVTRDLFDTPQTQSKINKAELSQAMDILNKRFGAGAINLGSCPKTDAGFVGTKIAFTRVPEQVEFSEEI